MYVQVGIKTRVEHFTNGILGPSVNGQMPRLAIGHRWSLIQILMAKGFNWPVAIELEPIAKDGQCPMVNGQWPYLLEAKDPQLVHYSYLDSSNPVPLWTYL